jgi:hypothetical protein
MTCYNLHFNAQQLKFDFIVDYVNIYVLQAFKLSFLMLENRGNGTGYDRGYTGYIMKVIETSIPVF